MTGEGAGRLVGQGRTLPRLVVLLVLTLAGSLLLQAAQSGRAYALHERIAIPRSLLPVTRISTVPTPVTLAVTGAVGCIFYCDDGIRWVQDQWDKLTAGNADGGHWLLQPNAANGPATTDQQWRFQWDPSGTFTGQNSYTEVGARMRMRCQVSDGSLLDLGWKALTPQMLHGQFDGSSTTFTGAPCQAAGADLGMVARVIDVQVERTNDYPNSTGAGKVSWHTDPTYKGSLSVRCRDGDAVTTMLQPIIATPDNEGLTVDGGNCESVLPGSFPDKMIGSSGAGWSQGLPVEQWATEVSDTTVTDYADCFTAAGHCGLRRVLDPDTGEEVCMWGAYRVALADCAGLPITTTPMPSTAPTVGPSTAPTAGPSSGPSSGPSAGPSSAPSGSPPPFPTEGGNDDPETQGCMGSWTWNPVAWVYRPVKCALQWAFVPSPSSLQAIKDGGAGLAGSVPFSYVADSVAWASGLTNAGTQCFALDVSTEQGGVKVLDTCQPRAFEAWLIANRSLLSVVMWAGFVLPMCWWAWRQYAPGATGVA